MTWLAAWGRGEVLASVALPAHLWLAPLLERVHDADRVLRAQVLVVIVAEALHALGVVGDGDHGRVHARAHALHLAQREHTVWRCLPDVDAQVLDQGVLDVLGTLQPGHGGGRVRGRAANITI